MSIREPNPVLHLLTEACTTFSEKLDRPRLVKRILEAALRLGNGERSAIFLAPEGAISDGGLKSLMATGLGASQIRVDIGHGLVGRVFRRHETLVIQDASNDPRFARATDEIPGFTTGSVLAIPVRTPGGHTLGVLQVAHRARDAFNDENRHALQILALIAACALESRETLASSNETNETNERRTSHVEICSKKSTNAELQGIYEKIGTYAQSGVSILIEGESGSGKEVMAQLIHYASPARQKPFLILNCAAVPENRLETELRGIAPGSTLFMDEIGELSLPAQAQLCASYKSKAQAPTSASSPLRIET